MEILEHWFDGPPYPLGSRHPDPAWDTLEEERREVLDAVLDSVSSGDPDAEHTAACLDLLEHVACLGLRRAGVRVS